MSGHPTTPEPLTPRKALSRLALVSLAVWGLLAAASLVEHDSDGLMAALLAGSAVLAGVAAAAD